MKIIIERKDLRKEVKCKREGSQEREREQEGKKEK